jgi:hypothetical protein
MTTEQNEDAGSTPAASTNSMPTIKKLHPTLKACKCGFMGSRTGLYNHLKQTERNVVKIMGYSWSDYYAKHGEVPLNEDDPRTKVGEQLKESLK